MRKRKCPECGEKYQPTRPLQPCCEKEDCRVRYAIRHIEAKRKRQKMQLSKAERIAKAEDRKTIKLKLDKLKTPHQRRSELIQQAEKAVRDYRRVFELNKGSGCMSCGRSQQQVIGTDGWKPGGAFDAGHYHGKGARPNLRLTPDNIWLQCKSCNGGSAKYARKGATVAKQYRDNLVKEIGLARVEELDADDAPRHWTEEELLAIRNEYRAKHKELMKQLAP
jgi:hypothetical protein